MEEVTNGNALISQERSKERRHAQCTSNVIKRKRDGGM